MASANLALFPVEGVFRRNRIYLPHTNHLETFSDKKLFKRYRYTRETLLLICDLMREDLERSTKRSHSLSVEIQVLIALRFFASGAFLEVIGDTFGVDKATVSRVVHHVADLLHNMSADFIRWPDHEEMKRIKRVFFEIAHFPKVLGCIDGTHVRIIMPSAPENADLQLLPLPPPRGEQLAEMNAIENDAEPVEEDAGRAVVHAAEPVLNYEASFVNRKGYHSLNVQAVCDFEGKFLNIVAKWPGATHDAYIWRNSNLKEHLDRDNAHGEEGVILGDSGYPCLPYLMVPYQNPNTAIKEKFNSALCGTRVRIEHAFGVLKRRFHVLHGEVRMRPERVIKIISACTVLHNIAILRRERDPPDSDSDDSDDDNDDDDDVGEDTQFADREQPGRVYRDLIANRYFK